MPWMASGGGQFAPGAVGCWHLPISAREPEGIEKAPFGSSREGNAVSKPFGVPWGAIANRMVEQQAA